VGSASDGSDFIKNIGGVTINKSLLHKYPEDKIKKYLINHRSFYFHKKNNSLIYTIKPTKNNVMDTIVMHVIKDKNL
jgi:glycerate-2-kinase